MSSIETDYLIVGCGAVGMAFADVILEESDARITILDDRPAPGGHWNDAYPFVTLHQPSAFYGVSSAELSRGRVDSRGLNAGMMELATGAEVTAYFQRVMSDRFLPSGQVDFRPLTRWDGDERATDLATGGVLEIKAGKIVDATYFGTTIPALHEPSFSVDAGATLIPLNDLPRRAAGAEDFVVIGGGKTAMDAVIWLLEHRVAPDRIRWVRPRDSWMINREATQPGEAYFTQTFGAVAAQFEAMAAAKDPDDLYDRLVEAGYFITLDPNVRPSMFRGATVSPAEANALRRVTNVIRMGHVTRISPDAVDLTGGTIPATPRTLHIDCSACAVTLRPPVPVFDGDRITLQMLRFPQPCFSAALIAHIELNYETQKQKNRLAQVVPMPAEYPDWIRSQAVMMLNQYNWTQDKALRAWITENRLDGFSRFARAVDQEDTEKIAILTRMRDAAQPAMANLMRMMAA